jgi:hypothetical protein
MSQSFSPPLPETARSARPGPVRPARAEPVEAARGEPAARWPRYRNPVRLAVSATPWRRTGYLAGFLACNYLVVATARARVHAR